MLQPPFHTASHDSLQYHFFCKDIFFSVRLFRTDSYHRSYVWLYDNGKQDVFDSNVSLTQSDAGHLDVSTTGLSVQAEDLNGNIIVTSGSGPDASIWRIDLTSRRDISPKDPFKREVENIIHQPDLEGRITHNGHTYEGTGFCKRYWGDYPRHWGWRFLHGVTDDNQMVVWSADATFGDMKMDYLHVVGKKGAEPVAAAPNTSFHKQDRVIGSINGETWEILIDEITRDERSLKSSMMDSALRQTYGRMTIHENGSTKRGWVFQEVCYGTLG